MLMIKAFLEIKFIDIALSQGYDFKHLFPLLKFSFKICKFAVYFRVSGIKKYTIVLIHTCSTAIRICLIFLRKLFVYSYFFFSMAIPLMVSLENSATSGTSCFSIINTALKLTNIEKWK